MKTKSISLILIVTLLFFTLLSCSGQRYKGDPFSTVPLPTTGNGPPDTITTADPQATTPPVTTAPPTTTEPPVIAPPSIDDVIVTIEQENLYRYPLDDINFFWSLIKSDGYNPTNIFNQYEKDIRNVPQWKYDDTLPGIYQFIKWYSQNFKTIEKERFEACNNELLKMPYPEYNILTQYEIAIMFTFNDDLVRQELIGVFTLCFEGNYYGPSYFATMDYCLKYGFDAESYLMCADSIPLDVLRRLKNSSELAELYLKLDKHSQYSPDCIKTKNTLIHFFEVFE